MKKGLLVLTSSLLLLGACNGNGESSSSLSSEESKESSLISSEESKESLESVSSESSESQGSSLESSSSESSASEGVDINAALDYFKSGFFVRSTYSKQYDDGTPSYKYHDCYLKGDLLKSVRYSDKFQTVYNGSGLNGMMLLQKDSEGIAQLLDMGIDGKISRSPLKTVDPVVNLDYETYWDDGGLKNAFSQFKASDFVVEEGKMKLVIPETQDDDFALALKSMGVQLFPYYDESYSSAASGYVHYFGLDYSLISFSVEIGENNLPGKYTAEFESYDSYDSTITQKLSGKFMKFGDDVALALPTEYAETDTTFGAKMTALKAGNFEASFKRQTESYYDTTKVTVDEGTLISDGEILEITDALSNNAVSGFKKMSDKSYRKYTASEGTYTYSGSVIEKDWLGNIIPLFGINSIFFTKTTSDEGDTYTYKGSASEVTTSPDASVFCGFGDAIGNIQPLSTFKITIGSNSVDFHNEVGVYITDVSFSNIGGVSSLSRTIAEPAE